MTPDEQLYTLMAHAEDLQQHAQTLQSRAKTALEGLPESVRAAGREVRALATRWIVIGAVVVVALGGRVCLHTSVTTWAASGPRPTHSGPRSQRWSRPPASWRARRGGWSWRRGQTSAVSYCRKV